MLWHPPDGTSEVEPFGVELIYCTLHSMVIHAMHPMFFRFFSFERHQVASCLLFDFMATFGKEFPSLLNQVWHVSQHQEPTKFPARWWFQHVSTPLKNMIVKLGSFPQKIGVKFQKTSQQKHQNHIKWILAMKFKFPMVFE